MRPHLKRKMERRGERKTVSQWFERRPNIPLATSNGGLIRKDLQSSISWAVWVLKQGTIARVVYRQQKLIS